MICAVECKRLFSALKIFKISLIGVPSNIPFFSEICVVIYIDSFSQVGLKSDVWKTASCYPPVFPDFSIALEAI